MILLQKDYSPGWMGVLINSGTGLRNSRTTLGGRTAYTPLVLDMDTRGMTWIVLHVINTLVKKITMNVPVLRVLTEVLAKMVKGHLAANVLQPTKDVYVKNLTNVPTALV